MNELSLYDELNLELQIILVHILFPPFNINLMIYNK
jgi:hypothetical protein